MQDGLTKVLMDQQKLVILLLWYLLNFSLGTAVVQHKWQELIDERCTNFPGNIDNMNKTGNDQESLTGVKIVDKAYLTAKFKAKVENEQNIKYCV
jgi:hypothetical protein